MDRIVTITHTPQGINVSLGNGLSYPFANQTNLAEAFARRLLACEDAERRCGELLTMIRAIGRDASDAVATKDAELMAKSLVHIRAIADEVEGAEK
jgi:hypothetical protein